MSWAIQHTYDPKRILFDAHPTHPYTHTLMHILHSISHLHNHCGTVGSAAHAHMILYAQVRVYVHFLWMHMLDNQSTHKEVRHRRSFMFAVDPFTVSSSFACSILS